MHNTSPQSAHELSITAVGQQEEKENEVYILGVK